MSVFGFWYRLPRLYEVGGGRFEDYWRENYPIQFRLRETCENVYISMSVFKRKLIENVWERMFPKNQWARNAIPHNYSDKIELVQEFLFECVIDFVENEPFESINWKCDASDSFRFKKSRCRILEKMGFERHSFSWSRMARKIQSSN